jgi:sulfatase modifying factor 1
MQAPMTIKQYVSQMRKIPGGSYNWGFSFEQRRSAPLVSITAFRMGATPVTWAMWKQFCKSESIKLPDEPPWGYPDNHPVVNVSWDDIMAPGGFCEWASKAVGMSLSLPSDAQWEYAARCNRDNPLKIFGMSEDLDDPRNDVKQGKEYPWGNKFDNFKVWCSFRSLGDAERTAAVDRKDRIYRNGFGLTDMVGNVHQWCRDYYHQDYRASGKNPKDVRRSNLHCLRGGSWLDNNPATFRCANRVGSNDSGSVNVGFRIVAGPK